MKTMKRFVERALGAGLVAVGLQAFAVPHVTIDGVAQRWPWNNRVDITYTVNGGQNVAAGQYYRLLFTATVDGTAYTVSGDTLGASAASGQHTVTWNNPPAGIKPTSLALTAAFYPADVPSGDDYMIVDLATGAVTYEGLLATQDASNARYNTAVYKTDKMVLRKVPGGGTYPTGDDKNYKKENPATDWTTDRDYYIGVFQVTCSQYEKFMTGKSWSFSGDYNSNLFETRAAHGVSWNNLRGTGTLPDASLTPDADGTFLQRLNARTLSVSGISGFDLPTELMYEIAQRAGAETVFSWGDSLNTNYVVCVENMTNMTEKTARVMSVGARLPNKWGLYDTAGNLWEWCLDDSGRSSLADAPDVFTPSSTGHAQRRLRGGGGFNSKAFGGDEFQFRASWRGGQAPDNTGFNRGFRVAWIRE